jgi:hypothetical protein
VLYPIIWARALTILTFSGECLTPALSAGTLRAAALVGEDDVGGAGGAAKGLFAGGKMGRGVGIGASLSFGFGVFSRVDEVAICRWNDFVADREVKERIRDVDTDMLRDCMVVNRLVTL